MSWAKPLFVRHAQLEGAKAVCARLLDQDAAGKHLG